MCAQNSPMIKLLFHTKVGALLPGDFHKNSLIATCLTLGNLEIRVSTPTRFKYQTNDSVKLLGHNYSHHC